MSKEGDLPMKSKLFVLALIAGGSLFAQSRFSITIGRGPGYYAPPPEYDRPYGAWGGYSYGYYDDRPYAGHWGSYEPEREHQRAEWYGLHRHQQEERFAEGDSDALREHQAQERWELRHEQWHERNGDPDASDGRAHQSARDGYRPRY